MVTRTLLDRFVAGSSTLLAFEVDGEGFVRRANEACARALGAAPDQLEGRPLADLLPVADAARVRGWLDTAEPPQEPVRLNLVASDTIPFSVRCAVTSGETGLEVVCERDAEEERETAEALLRLSNEMANLARERARRERELERTRRELEGTLEELRTSYWHLQKIQEALPVCMRCARVKGDEARWQSVVEYLKDNDIFVSHGYCPTCADAVLEEYGLDG